MNLAKEHIYLIFFIQNEFIQNIGEVQILIHKERDIEKWKNPYLVKQEAIDYFKIRTPEYNEAKLSAIFTGDCIPNV